MKLRILALALLVSGCASTSKVLEAQPRQTYTSSKSLAALEECLALKLSWLGTPNTVRAPERTIMPYGSPAPAITLALVSGPTSNIVELRSAVKTASRVNKSIAACL